MATHKGHITIPFEAHEHSKKFIGWQVKGSRLIRGDGEYLLHVTFRRLEREAEGVLGIDVNEKSIDLAIIKPNKVRFVKIDISDARYIRDRYFRKRRSIQTTRSSRVRLLAKYSGREKRRINDILHRASKIIEIVFIEIVSEEDIKPVMENLNGIREKKINYGRRMNRRLHGLPFRKIQFYI